MCLGRMCGERLEGLETVYTTPGGTVAAETTPVARATVVGGYIAVMAGAGMEG